jgi:hypothetical protein
MKYVRKEENGKVVWKREPKALLSNARIKEIEKMRIDEVKELATEDKVIWFYSKINELKREVQRVRCYIPSPPIIILVERSHFLRDSFEQFRTITDLDLRKELKIHFVDEVCQDAGGLIRDWFSVLTEELFAEKFGLFVRTNTPIVSYTINTNSKKLHANHFEYFFFCGQIIAKALFEKIPIKAYLAKFILKNFVDEEIVEEDLKYFDDELWKSIKFLKSNSIQGEFCIGTFTVVRRDTIEQKNETVNLKKNGDKISISEENKGEFIKLLYQYHLMESINEQLSALSSGIISLIPKDILCALDRDELEFILCGDQEISLEDWKENTHYKGIYNKSHPIIKWFWDILSKLSNNDLEKFFRFCTGSTRVPIEGFKGLTSNNGKLCGFSIEPRSYDNEEMNFIIAHTCFNRIEVPLYPTMEAMEKSIKKIISTPICYQFSFE